MGGVQPWTLTARLYPGARWRGTVATAAEAQTVDMKPVGLEEKAAAFHAGESRGAGDPSVLSAGTLDQRLQVFPLKCLLRVGPAHEEQRIEVTLTTMECDSEIEVQVAAIDDTAVGVVNRALDDLPQLADISRPWGGTQSLACGGCEVLRRESNTSTQFRQEPLRKQDRIVSAPQIVPPPVSEETGTDGQVPGSDSVANPAEEGSPEKPMEKAPAKRGNSKHNRTDVPDPFETQTDRRPGRGGRGGKGGG